MGGDGCRDGAARRGDAQAGGEVSASTWGWGRTSPPPGRPLHPRARRSQAGRGWGGGCRRSPKSRSAARCRARAEAPRGELGAAAERQERVRKGFQLCVCALLRYPAVGWVPRAHAGPAATAREASERGVSGARSGGAEAGQPLRLAPRRPHAQGTEEPEVRREKAQSERQGAGWPCPAAQRSGRVPKAGGGEQREGGRRGGLGVLTLTLANALCSHIW